MPEQSQQSIGLAELIQQVKQELLSTVPGKAKEAPILSRNTLFGFLRSFGDALAD